jgi:hypothetical protein
MFQTAAKYQFRRLLIAPEETQTLVLNGRIGGMVMEDYPYLFIRRKFGNDVLKAFARVLAECIDRESKML